MGSKNGGKVGSVLTIDTNCSFKLKPGDAAPAADSKDRLAGARILFDEQSFHLVVVVRRGLPDLLLNLWVVEASSALLV